MPRLRYDHWLTRAVGYEALLQADRRRAHLACAEAIEAEWVERAGSARDDVDAARRDASALAALIFRDEARSITSFGRSAELAHHWEVAGRADRAFLWRTAHAYALERENRTDEARREGLRALAFAAREQLPADWCAEAALGVGYTEVRLAHFREALERYEGVEAEVSSRSDAAAESLRFRAGAGRGLTLWSVGRYDESAAVLEGVLAWARETGHRALEASASMYLGNVLTSRGAFDRSLDLFLRCEGEHERAGNRKAAAAARSNIGSVRWLRGELREATLDMGRALEVQRAIGDRYGEGISLGNIGTARTALVGAEGSLAMLLEAAALRGAAGDRAGEVSVRINIAGARISAGEFESAIEGLRATVDDCLRLGIADLEAEAYAMRAIAHSRLGHTDEGAADASRSAALAERTGSIVARVLSLVARGMALRDPTPAVEGVGVAADNSVPVYLCEALIHTAWIQKCCGDRAASGVSLDRAEAVACEHGMEGIVRRVARERAEPVRSSA